MGPRCAARKYFVSSSLTIVTVLVTEGSYLAILDVARMHAGSRGEGGARGRTCNPLPGGFGHQSLGTRTGARGARWTQGQAGAGNTRLAKAATSQETWPEAEPRTTTRPLGENRGGTPIDVRLSVERRGRARWSRQNTTIASVGVLLPILFFPFFPFFLSSLPGIAVRRTASLRSAYA